MTKLFVRLSDYWRSLIAKEESERRFYRFITIFVGIWTCYDVLDIFWGGTASIYWLEAAESAILSRLLHVQYALVLTQSLIIGVVVGPARRSHFFLRCLLILAAGLRGYEVLEFCNLNDFYFYILMLLMLAQFRPSRSVGRLALWPRVFLRYQVAWIYFATALLKCNPHWLSGDHLWIRQNYQFEVLKWPYPSIVGAFMTKQTTNQVLAWAGIFGEFTLSTLLATAMRRKYILVLASLLHGFAALALNVWFFSLSMVALVAYVSDDQGETKESA